MLLRRIKAGLRICLADCLGFEVLIDIIAVVFNCFY
jgi:hypothetical protein